MQGSFATLRITDELLSLFELYTCRDRLPVAHYFDLDHIPNLTSAEGVSEIVEIVDGLVGELHQDVSRSQPSFGRWRIRFHVGELDSGFHLAEVRNRTEVG